MTYFEKSALNIDRDPFNIILDSRESNTSE